MKRQLAFPLRALIGAATAFLLSSVARSQNAWLVGTYPGSHFVTLQEAIESPLVKPRDALFVFAPRPSGPVTTNKPLTLLGLRGGGFGLLCPLTVRDIPVGDRFEIIGGSADSLAGRDEYIHFENCDGQILLSRVWNMPTLPGPPSILFRNCPRVSINQCSLHEAAIIDSTAAIARTTFDLIGNTYGIPPLYLQGSDVTMAGCNATTLPAALNVRSPPTIVMDRGRLHITGANGDGIYTAGGITQANYGIWSNGGEVVIDPDVLLNPSGAHPPLGGSSRFTFEQMAFIKVTHQGPGYLIAPQAFGTPGDTASMFVGVSAERSLALPGLGDLWMTPAFMWHLGTRTFNQIAEESFVTLIPPTVPIGTPLTFQMLTLTPSGVAKVSMPSEVPVAQAICPRCQ